MNFTKKSRKPLFLGLLLSLVVMASCNIYKTFNIDPINNESISSVYKSRYMVIVHEQDAAIEYALMNMVVEKDSIKGELVFPPPGRKHKPHMKSFNKSLVKAYDPKKAMHIYTSVSDIFSEEFSLPISSITEIEIHDKNHGASMLVISGMVATIIFVGAASDPYSAFNFNCACPQVSTYDSEVSQFHGSLFPGSIFKSLKRADYLILEDFVSEQGGLKLRVSNDLPEIEYIDQLSLLEVDRTGFESLGVNDGGELIAYNDGIPAKSVAVGKEELKNILAAKDDLVYDFNDPNATDQLNAITLKFDRADISKNPYLVIRGKQSQWLETVANYTFFNIGKSYDNWVKRKDKASGEKWKRKNMRQGVSLNVYLKNKDQWQYIGTHHDAGTLAMRNLLMALDLENHESPTIEIKLESAYKIWEIDYVGLTNSWESDLSVNQLDFITATDQNGNDISAKIKSTDEVYQVQENSGTYIDLQYEGLMTKPSTSLVLHGSGYYHHVRDYDHKADLKFVREVKSKLGVQDVSRDLYHYKTVMAFVASD